MKTKKILLPGMVAALAFAACTNEDIVSQQTVAVPESDLSSRPVVGMVDLNFGPAAQTRAEMGENFNDIEWTSVDKIGARIIDNFTGSKACHAAHNYTVSSEYAWSNYRYDFNNGDWTSDALMVEGNYMFYAPYDASALYRTPLKMKFPTVQKVSGLTAVEDYAAGGVGGNTSAIKNFYANEEGQTVVVGHTFIDAKDGGMSVSPEMTHLYAYPLITIVNDYKIAVEEEKDGEEVTVMVGQPITIDQITIESDHIFANYTIDQQGLAKALKLDIEAIKVNGDNDYDDAGECAGEKQQNWASEGVKSGWFLRNAVTEVIADEFDTKLTEEQLKKGEVDPDGKITIELDEPLTIPAGYGVKLNVVMPAAVYAINNFKVNVRVVVEEDGETVYKKFNQNTFLFKGDEVLADELKYAVSKQIPAEEYNFKADGTTSAKASWGTLATFHLEGELIDVEAEIVDPAGIKNNAQFSSWLATVVDNSTSKYEKVFAVVDGKEVEQNNPDASRKGDFRLASDHKVEFNAELVAAVDEYLNDEKAKVYFCSALNVVGGTAEKPLVINGDKYPKFGKLTVKSGVVVLDDVQVAELVVENGSVIMSGNTSIAKISEVKGNVTLDGATLTAANDKGITFKGTANLTNVTINGKAIFNEAATISGGSFDAVEFNKGGSLSGAITVDGEATVNGGEVVAGNTAGWATVNLYGGSLKITNKDYAPVVNVGTYRTVNNKNVEYAGTLTAAAEDLVLPNVTLNTANSKFIVNNDVELTAHTWTKGSVENNATLKASLTVEAGNTYTHNAEAVLDGTLANNGTVYNNGKLALTNNANVIVGATGFTKTDVTGGTGRIDNTALGYVTGTTTEQTIFVKTGAFSNDDAWKELETANSKVNTLYINGKWTVTKNVYAGVFNYEFVGGGLDLGAATIDFQNAKSVKILANQTWEGLDADVSVISNADLTFGSEKNADEVDVFYTLTVKDINMGDSYADALAVAIAAGGNVTLGADVVLSSFLKLDGVNVVLNLNGKTVTRNAVEGKTGVCAIYATNGADLTIQGTGGFASAEHVVWAEGEGTEVTIKAGTFTSTEDYKGEHGHAVYAQNEAVVNIEGGTFSCQGNGSNYVVNCNDDTDAKIYISGGKFLNFGAEMAEKVGEGEVNLVEGYTWTSTADANGFYSVKRIS